LIHETFVLDLQEALSKAVRDLRQLVPASLLRSPVISPTVASDPQRHKRRDNET